MAARFISVIYILFSFNSTAASSFSIWFICVEKEWKKNRMRNLFQVFLLLHYFILNRKVFNVPQMSSWSLVHNDKGDSGEWIRKETNNPTAEQRDNTWLLAHLTRKKRRRREWDAKNFFSPLNWCRGDEKLSTELMCSVGKLKSSKQQQRIRNLWRTLKLQTCVI